MENHVMLNAFCSSVTCCGCILDYKSIFDEDAMSPDNEDGTNEQSSNERHRFAWILSIWRMILYGVGWFNIILDGFFIYELYTKDDVERKYAHWMLVASFLSLFSEHVIWTPIFNQYSKIIRNWRDRLDLLNTAFVSGLVSYWIEDVMTIYLFFKVDDVFDRDSVADMMNLFASIVAGCLGLVSLFVVPVISAAGDFGAFDQGLSYGKRGCACLDCSCYCCWYESLLQSEMSEEERKERRKAKETNFALVIGAIVATAYPSYVAVWEIYLGDSEDGMSDDSCKDVDTTFYSSDLHDLVRCDSLDDYIMCSKLDIRKHCRVTCDSCDEVFFNDNDDFFDRDSSKKGVPDEVMLISFIIGLLLLIIGIYVRIQLYSTSAEEWRETVERENR
ncbi:predicted protein [Chaetoceros tenuissimus]|uniref:Uncharacterized protein n=1 Tax=Chaetoceros tenuissimus TaxID=426638 RepID=A0AAD3D342_9STRA|nr:predicted protein [Chaetoceros tenuissimus]